MSETSGAGRLRGEPSGGPGAVLIATSEFDVTTSTVVVGAGGGCLLIDPGVTVPELAGLAAELAGRGLRPRVAWSTHPHWDHVLWHRELGDVPRYAAPAAVAIADRDREAILGEARRSAPGHEAALIGRLAALDAGAIPWDGPAAQLIIHDGHAPGHGAVFLPGSGTLIAGDMCSDIEIPLLDTLGADPVGDYRLALTRLSALREVRRVIPGHGHAGDAAEFRRRLAADGAYLDALERGKPFSDPRITKDWLRAAHERQLRLARAGG
ncbi:MAG: MBL fold metallo-hydrolase [Streptosporangiaceae bacterium]|nr:MBL fold metallo-hydrolase [Streptosporangiaceae bacterium]MBV9855226.1 MBL fold metallo-hydrolase [Streptosporangiaceae bacterium]